MSKCGRCRRPLLATVPSHGWYGGQLACSQQCGAALQRLGARPSDDDESSIDYGDDDDYPDDYADDADDADIEAMQREQRQNTLRALNPGVLVRTRDASFDYVAQVLDADADGMVTVRALLRREQAGHTWTALWDEQFLQLLTGDDYGVRLSSVLSGGLDAASDELAALRAAYPLRSGCVFHNRRTDRTNACRVLTPPTADGMVLVGHLATADALSLAYATPIEARVPVGAVSTGDGGTVNVLRIQAVHEGGRVVAIVATQPELTAAYEQVATRDGMLIRLKATGAGGTAHELATREMSDYEASRQVGFAPDTDRVHLWGWWDAEADTLRIVHFHVPANASEVAFAVHTIDAAPGGREPDDYWFAQRAAKARTADGGFVVLVWAKRVHRVYYAPAEPRTLVRAAMFEYNVVPPRHALVRVGDWIGRVRALPRGLDARTEAIDADEPCDGDRIDTCPRIGVKSSADLAGRVQIDWLGSMRDDTIRIGLAGVKQPVECVTACGVAPLSATAPEHALFTRTLDHDRAVRVGDMLDQVATTVDRLRRAPLPLGAEHEADARQAETLLARVFDSELIGFYTQPGDLVQRSDELRLRLASALRAVRLGGGGTKRSAGDDGGGAKRTLAARIGRFRLK